MVYYLRKYSKVLKVMPLHYFWIYQPFPIAIFGRLLLSGIAKIILGQSGQEKRWNESFQVRAKAEPWHGYQLSPNYFQKFKWMPAPDWAQKRLCIIVPN